MPEYTPEEKPTCPHGCGFTFDEPARDHVLPGKVGAASRSKDECGGCEGFYTAETLPSGKILFEKADPPEEERSYYDD